MGKITKLMEKAREEQLRFTPPAATIPEKEPEREPSAEQVIPSRKEPATPPAHGGGIVFQGAVSPRLIVFHEPDSVAAEHFKVLRTQILFPKDGIERKVILVTSSDAQEGKTFVACNLAASIAQSVDPYCLLIDADLRRPNVHAMLGLDPARGLSEYLQGDAPLGDFFAKSSLTKLTILPAGRPPRNPSELMTSEKMGRLVSEVRDRYPDRHVIIDSPPVNLAAETLNLAQWADAVVFVVRFGKTNRDHAEEAIEKIGREKILGVVFNGLEGKPRRYSYYGKKYHSGV